MFLQIMSDKNMEDNDIEPAPKLIQVVFQNCRGQVDRWVEPYLRITVERLRRTEKSYLKCLLMQVVKSQALVHYHLSHVIHKLILVILRNNDSLWFFCISFWLIFSFVAGCWCSLLQCSFDTEHTAKHGRCNRNLWSLVADAATS